MIKQLGRGVSETTVANAKDGDAALLARIQEKPRHGEEPVVAPFEASRIIDQLRQAEVDDVVQAGDAYCVSTRVLGGVTTHILKMPSAKDVFEHLRGFAARRPVRSLPVDHLDATQMTQPGPVIRRALDMISALSLGIRISLEEVPADEFYTMMIIAAERSARDWEKVIERSRPYVGRSLRQQFYESPVHLPQSS